MELVDGIDAPPFPLHCAVTVRIYAPRYPYALAKKMCLCTFFLNARTGWFVSVPVFVHKKTPLCAESFYGAGGRNRTPDLLITSQLLYLLSYTSGYWI